MVALRALWGEDNAAHQPAPPAVDRAADWLTIQQAACELDVSATTIRRMMRDGRLRHRMASRHNRRIYLIYMPDSRHAKPMARETIVDLTERIRERDERRAPGDTAARDDVVDQLQRQVENLSEALARALRLRQKSLPEGMGQLSADPADPYERYRWMARRRRWWPFS